MEKNDYGTPEIHRRQIVKPELTGLGHAVRMRVQDANELDRLALKGLITSIQHSAGDSLSRDLHKAKLLGMATINFSGEGRGGGGHLTDAHADAFARVGDAIRYVDWAAGVAVRSLTVNVCLSLSRIEASQVQEIQAGLEALVQFYEPKSSSALSLLA